MSVCVSDTGTTNVHQWVRIVAVSCHIDCFCVIKLLRMQTSHMSVVAELSTAL